MEKSIFRVEKSYFDRVLRHNNRYSLLKDIKAYTVELAPARYSLISSERSKSDIFGSKRKVSV